MEEANNEIGEARHTVPTIDQEPTALDIIRTETVLSRLPVHNLAKRGNVNIQILKTAPDGKIELKWIVSYSDRYGQARQLAYKLDTIVINHHIDEQGRPLPKMICLGSLRDIANQLDLGGDTNKVRRALRQNASAFITAKFEYRGNDGSKKTLEADFTRYSVVFTGEQLPDGRRADAVYIILNEPYREVLNNAPVRPLDRAYMKELPPAAQRFYEIISYKIFSTIKNHYPHAKIAYSEYCTFSAQLRHYERQSVQDQMAKVIRPHKQSGYITALRYEPTIDAENKPDWTLYLTPGPKAHSEFAIAHGRKPRKAHLPNETEAWDRQVRRSRIATRERNQEPEPIGVRERFDPRLVAEFTRRGITEEKAVHLLANLKPGQDVVAQLEHIEQTIQLSQHTPNPIRNPAGFYISLIERNMPLPDGFETSAMRQAREELQRSEQRERAAKEAEQQLEDEYENYCDLEIDRYIEANRAAFEEIKQRKWKEDREQFAFAPESMANIAAKNEIRKQLTFPTFEEFVDRKRQGTAFSLKPVAVSASFNLPVEPAHEALAGEGPTVSAVEMDTSIETGPESATRGAEPDSAPAAESTTEEEATMASTNEPATSEERVHVSQAPAEEPPPSSGLVILLATEPPPPEQPGSDPIGPNLA
jgi:hypothetical protein